MYTFTKARPKDVLPRRADGISKTVEGKVRRLVMAIQIGDQKEATKPTNGDVMNHIARLSMPAMPSVGNRYIMARDAHLARLTPKCRSTSTPACQRGTSSSSTCLENPLTVQYDDMDAGFVPHIATGTLRASCAVQCTCACIAK